MTTEGEDFHLAREEKSESVRPGRGERRSANAVLRALRKRARHSSQQTNESRARAHRGKGDKGEGEEEPDDVGRPRCLTCSPFPKGDHYEFRPKFPRSFSAARKKTRTLFTQLSREGVKHHFFEMGRGAWPVCTHTRASYTTHPFICCPLSHPSTCREGLPFSFLPKTKVLFCAVGEGQRQDHQENRTPLGELSSYSRATMTEMSRNVEALRLSAHKSATRREKSVLSA